ncbi:MAG TPA: alpha/beta fold hydrolase [Actinomycetota bacterium]|nr:alpha/beta fold hydrolase [Actinomycetota bacterium]
MFHPGIELAMGNDYQGIAPLAQRTHREVIMLDQRGTGHSEPPLACPEVRAMSEKVLGARLSDPSARDALTSAAAVCHDRLVSEGIDPSAYTLEAAAADAEDLRRALSIERWNIHVIGTASRITMEMIRRFPEHIRSVQLDSPQFPQLEGLTEAPRDLRDAMGQLFAACAKDARCDRAFPELATAFVEVITQLNADPVTVSVRRGSHGIDLDHPVNVIVDGAAFVRAIRVMVSDGGPEGAPLVPLTVSAAHRGDLRLAARFLALDPGGCVGYLPFCEWNDYSEGTYYSFLCHDEVPFVDPSRLESWAAGDQGIVEAFGRSPYPDICEVWPVGKTDAVANEPVSSDIPTLIFHGAFDAYSPASLVEEAEARLSSAYLVEFPYNGHNLLAFDCPRRFRNVWVDAPTLPPDTGCVVRMPAPRFALR